MLCNESGGPQFDGGRRSPRNRHQVYDLLPGSRLSLDVFGIEIEHTLPGPLLDQVAQRLRHDGEPQLAIGSVNLDHIHHFARRTGARSGRVRPGHAGTVDWLMLIDGAPVARRARAVSGVHWPRLAGADLLPDLLSVAERTGARVGFLGGHEQTVPALRARLDACWPSLRVAGFWTPTRTTVDCASASDQLADAIKATGVDLLVVGLGKPRQEDWIDRHGARTGARVSLAFGAAADFLAGSARRAPGWMRNAGCEWLFRLVQEPRRLSRRYLLEGPLALWSLRHSKASISYQRPMLIRADGLPTGSGDVTAGSGASRAPAPSPRW